MKKSNAKQKICGIYKITNNLNGKCYVGQSKDIKRRWKEHQSKWMQRNEPQKALYRAFKKYGVENFSFEILQKCPVAELDEREEYWIRKLDSCKNGYNMNNGGHSHCGHHNYKRKHKREYRYWQKEFDTLNPELIPNICKTFQTMKAAMLPYPDDEDDALEYIDDDFVEELDGYDTLLHDFCDGYDSYEQWAECNLI